MAGIRLSTSSGSAIGPPFTRTTIVFGYAVQTHTAMYSDSESTKRIITRLHEAHNSESRVTSHDMDMQWTSCSGQVTQPEILSRAPHMQMDIKPATGYISAPAHAHAHQIPVQWTSVLQLIAPALPTLPVTMPPELRYQLDR